MKTILLVALICLLIPTVSGQNKQNYLIGTWELAKEDNGVDTESLMIPIGKSDDSGKQQNKQEIVIKFNDNSIADFKQGKNSFKANYIRKKDKLTLGSTQYKILKLDSDSLIIVEENQLIPTTYFYCKSDKKFKTIKEFEKVEEKYSNGQTKTKGTYRNGFEDGLWEEWFENGKKKSEKKFKNGIPVGVWKEWDKTGVLIKEIIMD